MTDAEIRQSYIDHWNQRWDNERIVRSNTPSRIGVVRPAARGRKTVSMIYDYVLDRYVEVPCEPRRR